MEDVPVPLRLTVCGLPVALSVLVRVPVRFPVAVGVKVTLIVQLAPALSALPQLLVWAKSPLSAMLAMVNVTVPVLPKVTTCGELAMPTS